MNALKLYGPWYVGNGYRDKRGMGACVVANLGEAQVSMTVHGSTPDAARRAAEHLAAVHAHFVAETRRDLAR